jgi:hypothetical protein
MTSLEWHQMGVAGYQIITIVNFPFHVIEYAVI